MARIIHSDTQWKSQWRDWLSTIDKGLFLNGTPAYATPSVIDDPHAASTEALVTAIARSQGNDDGLISWDDDTRRLQEDVNRIVSAAILNSYPASPVDYCHVDARNSEAVTSVVEAWTDFRQLPSPESQQALRDTVTTLLEASPDMARDVIWTEDRILMAIEILGDYTNPLPSVADIAAAGGMQRIMEHRLQDGLATSGVQDPAFLRNATLTVDTIDAGLAVAQEAVEALVTLEDDFTLAARDLTVDAFEQTTGTTAGKSTARGARAALTSAAQLFIRTHAAREHPFEIAEGAIEDHVEHSVAPRSLHTTTGRA